MYSNALAAGHFDNCEGMEMAACIVESIEELEAISSACGNMYKEDNKEMIIKYIIEIGHSLAHINMHIRKSEYFKTIADAYDI